MTHANKIGSVFLVNEATDGDQGYLLSSSNFTGHSVTPLDNDGFTITWESQDGITNRVFSQIFDANNQKVLMHDINEDKKVNTFTTGDQSNSDVVTLSNGNYVVTWHSLNQNGYRSQAMGQIFSSIGDKIGSEFKNYPDSGASDFAAWYTSLSATQNGGFAVTWGRWTRRLKC